MFDFFAQTRREAFTRHHTEQIFDFETSRSVHRIEDATAQVCPSSLPLLSSCL